MTDRSLGVSELLEPPAPSASPSLEQRILAAVEVALCSDFPTQLTLTMLFLRLGIGGGSQFDIGFITPLLLTDTVVLLGLIFLFLRAHGERPSEVFLGDRPWREELRAAIPMTFLAYGIAISLLLTLAAVAPWLHTVTENPLQSLIEAPGDAAIFALVVVIAGGIREEMQRAFILRRFEQSLGGPVVGVAVSSLAFGVGHLVQGADAAITTGVLGAFWGVTYLRRRSVIAPVISHAGFDLLQIAIFFATAR
ncbi:MAG: CPBP family intramembrane glutamic endopeptidase [Vicinamibacterales bacterium]